MRDKLKIQKEIDRLYPKVEKTFLSKKIEVNI